MRNSTTVVMLMLLVASFCLLAGCGSEQHTLQTNPPRVTSSFSSALEQTGTNTRVVSALELPDGSKIIVGNVNDSHLRRSASVTRLSENGIVLWSKKISHQKTTETIVSKARLAPNGTIFLAGCAVEAIQENPLSIRTKGAAWLCQLDAEGNVLKDVALRNGDPKVTNETASDVAFSGTNIIIVGDVSQDLGWQRYNSDVIAICLDSSWQVVWANRYDSFKTEQAGSCVLSGTKLVVSSTTRNDGFANLDASLLAIDASGGNVLVSRNYTAKPASLFANDMVVDGNGDIVVAGYCDLYGGPNHGAIWKLDSSNLHSKWYSFFKYHGTSIAQIAAAPGGGYFATGFVNAEVSGNYDPIGMIAEIGSDGVPSRGAKIPIGPENDFSALLIPSAGGIMVAGSSTLDASPNYFHNMLALQGDLFASQLVVPITFSAVTASVTESVVTTTPVEIVLSKLNFEVVVADVVLTSKGL